MMMTIISSPVLQLTPVVHTAGVNWESVGVIVAIIAGIVLPVIAFLVRLVGKQIQTAVEHLEDVLVERLETKENVSKISERIARLEERDRTRHRW